MNYSHRLKIGIIGSSGRMGAALKRILDHHPKYEIILGINRADESNFLHNLKQIFILADIVIDFSNPEITLEILKSANLPASKASLVLCTTGWSDTGEIKQELQALAAKSTIIVASNTSVGATLQMYLVKKMAAILPDNYDIDIFEKHHRYKKDTPSGTAKSLAQSIQSATPNENKSIHIQSQRSGHLPGDHEVSFTSELERISVQHIAYDRELFAQGAIVICDWISKKKAANPNFQGRYSMFDVLELL